MKNQNPKSRGSHLPSLHSFMSAFRLMRCIVLGVAFLSSTAFSGEGEPSLDATVDFIVRKLNGHEIVQNLFEEGLSHKKTFKYQCIRVENSVLITVRSACVDRDREGRIYTSDVLYNRYYIDANRRNFMSQIKFAMQYDKVIEGDVIPTENQIDWNEIEWTTGDAFCADYFDLKEPQDYIFDHSDAIGLGEMEIYFERCDSDLASRLSQALNHLMILSGAIKDPF